MYLLVYPVPDHLLLSSFAARAAQAATVAAGLRWRREKPGGDDEGGGGQERRDGGDGRVTVGYVSADFVQHPVSLLFQVHPSHVLAYSIKSRHCMCMGRLSRVAP